VNRAQLCSDVEKFRRAVEEGRLQEAAALYRGEFLPGLHVAGAPAFERWFVSERFRLRKQAAKVLGDLAGDAGYESDDARATEWARRAVEVCR